MADVVPLDAAKPSHDAPDLEKRSSQDLVEKEKIKAGESQQAPNNHKEMAVDEKPTSSATGAGCTIPSESAATNNATEKQPQVGPQFPELTSDHPLSKLLQRLPSILESARYAEVYGVDISNPNSGHTKNILQKFLRANSNDVAKAEEQLLGTLKWRREFNPLAALEEVHSRNKFYGLGYVTTLKSDGDLATQRDIVVSWNIYGAVESNEVTFGDVDRYNDSQINACVSVKPTNNSVQLRPLARRPHGTLPAKTQPGLRHARDPRLGRDADRREPRPVPVHPGARLPQRLVPAPGPAGQGREQEDHRHFFALLPGDAEPQVLRQRSGAHGLGLQRLQARAAEGDGAQVYGP